MRDLVKPRTYVYSGKPHGHTQFLCFSVFMPIQLVEEEKGKNSKLANLNQRSLYDSLKEQPIFLSISRDPSITRHFVTIRKMTVNLDIS